MRLVLVIVACLTISFTAKSQKPAEPDSAKAFVTKFLWFYHDYNFRSDADRAELMTYLSPSMIDSIQSCCPNKYQLNGIRVYEWDIDTVIGNEVTVLSCHHVCGYNGYTRRTIYTVIYEDGELYFKPALRVPCSNGYWINPWRITEKIE